MFTPEISIFGCVLIRSILLYGIVDFIKMASPPLVVKLLLENKLE